MSLKVRLTDDMKAAMKGGEKDRLGVIRLLNAAIKQREVDERIELDDAQVLAVLEKQVKQRKDSLTQYENAGREDLAAVERYELGVIDAYLPAKMATAELEAEVAAAIAETGDFGHGQGHGDFEAEARRPRRHGRAVRAGAQRPREVAVPL